MVKLSSKNIYIIDYEIVLSFTANSSRK